MSAAALAALPLIPALAGGVLLLRPPGAERAAGSTAVLAALVATALAIVALGSPATAQWAWIDERLGLGLDSRGANGPLTLTVAAVTLLVNLYAARFLGTGEARARFFGLMSLFLGAMLGLVLARDLLTTLIAWELVGMCSYALIGFWFAEEHRARDAMRAFLTTRFADLGLYLAAMAAWAGGTLVLAELDDLPAGLRDLAMGGIVVAAIGKSAQLPLSGWLRGAMSGPTPVSALLHSATMVAAGAVLLIKVVSLVAAVAWAGPVILWTGGATVLIGAAIALGQDDLKQLLAASTVSQYGYMFAAIGALGAASASAHLVNHAAFKALLFLAAGVLILEGYHALSEMGGLRRGRPLLAMLFLVGALSLAALPPFGGFFSKEKILAVVFEQAPMAFWLLIAAAVLTAWYAGRAWLGVFAGPGRREANSRPDLLAPGAVLAIAAITGGGLLLGPVENWWAGLFPGGLPEFRVWEIAVSAAAAVLGLALAAIAHRGRMRLPKRLRASAGEWFGLPRLIDGAGGAVAEAARLIDRAAARLPEPESAARSALVAAQTARAGDERLLDRLPREMALGSRDAADRSAWLDRRAIDGALAALHRGLGAADQSDWLDRRAIDGALAALDRGLGAGATWLARAQSGLLHQYYAGAAIGVGTLIVLAIALLTR